MKKKMLILMAFCTCIKIAAAQSPDLIHIADSVEREGKTLYQSEIASWYGTDIFLEKCKGKAGRIGGYVSYDTGSGMNNIFFSRDEVPVVLATMSFPYDVKPQNCTIDSTERKLTDVETRLYHLRQTAIKLINANKDTIFRFYNNTSLNPIPIIINGQKRVYALTAPKNNGVVLFGNDYLLTFDQQDRLIKTLKLHKGLIPESTRQMGKDSGSIALASVHTHLPEYSPYITATDICTLMLYEKSTTWNQHVVISKDFVSIWDCKRDKLAILTQEAWKKINAAKSALETSKN
ncbi:MAG: hypothetical protein V4592_03790 [Bacteroidota bacterium]